METPSDLHLFHHDLIQGEFRGALTTAEHDIAPDTDAVVVLSAYEFTPPEGGAPMDMSLRENAENFARIQVATELAREVAAKRAGKPVADLTIEDMQAAPRLILNGTTTQLPWMERLAADLGFAEDAIQPLDCGPKEVANTKTQFDVLNDYVDTAHPARLALVTSDYHVPRVQRTANKNLPTVPFDVFQVPHDRLPAYDVTRVVKGEVRRIGTYAAKGDITWHA